ncbi:hypothetical protein HK100_001707, partial [Physocladia obscura]
MMYCGEEIQSKQLERLPPPAPGSAHKRYTSVYPCTNRLLAKRWDDAAREKHQLKLSTMKTYIDSAPPKVQDHLNARAKKLLVEDQKLSRIEHENHILLARLARQMSVIEGFSGLDTDYKLKVTAPLPASSQRKKKEIMEQIHESNQILLQRVEAKLPYYCQEVWTEERRTNLTYFQRISRFPEGYHKVLNREGVPPPLKVPLRRRINRSEILRQKWAIESKLNLDEFGNPKRIASSNTNENINYSSDEDHPKKFSNIYLTKSEKIRREYIKALRDGGGEKKWRENHTLYPNDPLDISAAKMKLASEDDASRSPGQKQSLKVRLNRAQHLRLEEQEEKKKEKEQIKLPTHLANIESRIDSRKELLRHEKIIEHAERDRENQLNTLNFDESEYEPNIIKNQAEIYELKNSTWNHVIQGISLRTGFRLPESYPVSVGVLWSSDAEDCGIERWHILSKVLPKIKLRAAQLGVEIFLRDLKWGIPKNLIDSQAHFEFESQQLERYMKESVGIHFISFISHKRGQLGFLPRMISCQLFGQLLEIITATENGDNKQQIINEWYKLNENIVPPMYCLANISSNFPEFSLAVNTHAFRNSKKMWIKAKENLLNCLNYAAIAILNTGNWTEEDFETLRMLTTSKIEVESLRAIQGPTEDAILIIRDLNFKDKITKENIGSYLDWNGDRPDEKAASDLKNLKKKLQSWIKDSNIIIDEVDFSPGFGLRLHDKDVARYISNITCSVHELLENSLQKATDRLHFDSVHEEVLRHSKLFEKAALAFTGKTRVVNKVSAFFHTRYKFGIPPLLVSSPLGDTSVTLLCKGLKKFLDEAISITQIIKFSELPTIVVRFIGETPDSSNSITLLKSICKQIKRANANISLPSSLLEIGSSPILETDAVPSDFSSLYNCFIECLKTATHERPIFIVLLNLDRIISDEIGYSLSWLPIENNIPHVHIAISISQIQQLQNENDISETIRIKMERAHLILAQMNREVFNDHSIILDMIDIATGHIEIKKWLYYDGINLSLQQRKAILTAATNTLTPNGTTTTHWILRCHYLLARRLKSWEVYSFNNHPSADFKSVEKELAEIMFDSAERIHGKKIVTRSSQILVICRDGISETGLEDLLSLDSDILSESISNQIENSVVTEISPLIPIPRVPAIVIVYLLNTLVNEYEIVVRGRGYERGPNLLKWCNEFIREVAKSRYLSDPKVSQTVIEDVAAYLNNDWTDSAKKGNKNQPISIYLKSVGADGENWKGNLNPHKLLPLHTNSWKIDDEIVYNLHRIRVLPRALIFSQRYRDLRKQFEDFLFLEAFVITWTEKNKPRQFLVTRAIWMAQYEQTKSFYPPGLLFQEFNNMPANTSAIFHNPIQIYLEDNLDFISSSRGGRLECETAWKQDQEVSNPLPIHHINVQCASVSVDGKWIASGASDGSIKVWNIATGEEILTFCHILSNDSVSNSDTMASSNQPEYIKPAKYGISFICFSGERNSLQLVSCAHDLKLEPSIRVWNLKSLNSTPRIMTGGHALGAKIVKCEFLPPENRRLMSVGSDFKVALWEVARCKIIRVLSVSDLNFDFDFDSVAGISSKKETTHSNKYQRQYESGYPKLAAGVSQIGLFAYGSTTITVTDAHWKDIFIRDINGHVDKNKIIKWHRLTAIEFSSDSINVFASSAVAPDDIQILTVERQKLVENLIKIEDCIDITYSKFTTKNLLQHEMLSNKSESIQAIISSATKLNATSVRAESEIKQAKQSIVRGWNIASGQLTLMIYIEDYITSLVLSQNSMFILTAGERGIITGHSRSTGKVEFIRQGHASGISQLCNVLATTKKRKEDEDSLYYTYSGQFNMSMSRSLGSLSGPSISAPLQFFSVGLDDKLILWTLDSEKPVPGEFPITKISFNSGGDLMISIGGISANSSMEQKALIRVWETATAVLRLALEVAAEVNYAVFFSETEAELKILVGCKRGMVRIYRFSTGEILREFWADVENALSPSILGYKLEWPFALTGVSVISYALHPHGRYLAVAVVGNEREPSVAITVANCKAHYACDILNRNAGKPLSVQPRQQFQEEVEKTADKFLLDVIKITFWDLEGNCLILSESFHFPIFFNASDHSSCAGPYNARPVLNRRECFVLGWSQDGRYLYASDDCEILKECTVDFKNGKVYNTVHSNEKFWKASHASPIVRYGVPCVNNIIKISENTVNLDTSAATAFHSIFNRRLEHTCFAYGNGIIALRSIDLENGRDELRWFLGHSVCGKE